MGVNNTPVKTVLLAFSEDSSGELMLMVGTKKFGKDITPINLLHGQAVSDIYKQLTNSSLELELRKGKK